MSNWNCDQSRLKMSCISVPGYNWKTIKVGELIMCFYWILCSRGNPGSGATKLHHNNMVTLTTAPRPLWCSGCTKENQYEHSWSLLSILEQLWNINQHQARPDGPFSQGRDETIYFIWHLKTQSLQKSGVVEAIFVKFLVWL